MKADQSTDILPANSCTHGHPTTPCHDLLTNDIWKTVTKAQSNLKWEMIQYQAKGQGSEKELWSLRNNDEES